MSRNLITLAKDGMRTDLERIWRLCFDDPPEYAKYFFDFRYNPNACAVYIDEAAGRPVAMLHMLDASITEDSEIVPVQYIYAAATRPDFQGRGIMRQLLEFARQYAIIKQQRYMILVPGSRELFRFYEKRGYYRCFKVRNVYMTESELRALAGEDNVRRGGRSTGKVAQSSILTQSDIHAVRRDMLADREGFVTWNYQAVKYAADVHKHLGGGIITATDGVDAGYAFCRQEGADKVVVSELICSDGYQKEIIRQILREYHCKQYEFRLPVYDELFAPFGEVSDYGMIAAVHGRKPVGFLTLSGIHQPYLGLALD